MILEPTTANIMGTMRIARQAHISKKKRNSGAIFCHVKSSRFLNHEMPPATLGNQKWNGKAPSLSRRPIIKIITPFSKESITPFVLRDQIKSGPKLSNLPSMIRADPTA
jgi:hypothetical protein